MRAWLNRRMKPHRLYLAHLPEDFTDPDALGADHFARPCASVGLDFQEDAQWRLLEEDLAVFKSEWADWPIHPDGKPDGFYIGNEYFGPLDAEVYYGLVRAKHPQRIIEVGGGFSTKLARLAIDRNGGPTWLAAVDPAPRSEIKDVVDQHWAMPVQQIPLVHFLSLKAGDFLFIDSSHRIETGGDLPFLFLEVLPRLASGVWVHFHDIHLPFDYPKYWIQDQRRGYNEQYALALMLMDTSHWTIRWASHWLAHRDADRVARTVPSVKRPDARAIPGSLWIERR